MYAKYNFLIPSSVPKLNQTFFLPNIFLGPKMFSVKKKFRTKLFITDHTFFSGSKCFWTKHFFTLKIFFSPKMNLNGNNLSREKTELLNLKFSKLARQGQRFYFNRSLTLKTKSHRYLMHISANQGHMKHENSNLPPYLKTVYILNCGLQDFLCWSPLGLFILFWTFFGLLL